MCVLTLLICAYLDFMKYTVLLGGFIFAFLHIILGYRNVKTGDNAQILTIC